MPGPIPEHRERGRSVRHPQGWAGWKRLGGRGKSRLGKCLLHIAHDSAFQSTVVIAIIKIFAPLCFAGNLVLHQCSVIARMDPCVAKVYCRRSQARSPLPRVKQKWHA